MESATRSDRFVGVEHFHCKCNPNFRHCILIGSVVHGYGYPILKSNQTLALQLLDAFSVPAFAKDSRRTEYWVNYRGARWFADTDKPPALVFTGKNAGARKSSDARKLSSS